MHSHTVVLTIAGFDPSSGAGITADVKTVSAYGGFAVAAITAYTVQNTQGVRSVHPVDPQVLAASLDALADDFAIAGVKIGMLASREHMEVVAKFLRRTSVAPVIVDPVLVSSSGLPLLEADAVAAFTTEFAPLATVMTPNAQELVSLTGSRDPESGAKILLSAGAKAVVVTNGEAAQPIDLLFTAAGNKRFEGRHVATNQTHGTGCAFATALACELVEGRPLEVAVRNAKEFVAGALRNAPGLGCGRGPLNHLWAVKR